MNERQKLFKIFIEEKFQRDLEELEEALSFDNPPIKPWLKRAYIYVIKKGLSKEEAIIRVNIKYFLTKAREFGLIPTEYFLILQNLIITYLKGDERNERKQNEHKKDK